MSAAEPVFGRLLTAMVTPFAEDGSLDLEAARVLARHLVDDLGNDGLVVNGTTGESPTTTTEEKAALVRAVVDEVGDRARVVSGAGSYDTEHTVGLAEQMTEAGAHGLLVVTPYYSRPTQAGLVAHFTTVAERTRLPIMLYDIPHRAGTAIDTETFVRVAEHERVVAVKDAKGDPVASSEVIARTGLEWYSGDDAMTLPLLAVGAVGVVGTSTHFTGRGMAELIAAHGRGDVAGALDLHRRLLPVLTGVFATQGCSMVKAGLALQGYRVGGVRLPMVPATDEQREVFAGQLRGLGLL
ncbi:4-hydroxy-tetrahydrodipicolinate synthase [Auraticoccus sp. F435]|uniref:4-hydroxy-tetrahydrodipicolinate synthase n=1 Tax=Auraticoccus cholistanensis TaxID=2656650 RepID=A0A6A9UTN1_9ACTN|nr:4-hydroxy-tetrahydrodipicolinate synthase [Auraticoccus cholistanensis]MVA76183.1 4-hydroxy-tetrahydrodipicolinate synthase [Auraticoccus cholistanensis]